MLWLISGTQWNWNDYGLLVWSRENILVKQFQCWKAKAPVNNNNKGKYTNFLSEQTNCPYLAVVSRAGFHCMCFSHLHQFLCLSYPFNSFWSHRWEVETVPGSPQLKMMLVHQESRPAQTGKDQRLQKHLGRARGRRKLLELCQYVQQNRIPGGRSSQQGNSSVLSNQDR